MEQANICIRIDKKLKEQFDKICDELGMSMSTALNMFVKTVVRENRVPLDLSLNTPNPETIKAIEDIENGIGLSKPYTDMNELFNDLGI